MLPAQILILAKLATEVPGAISVVSQIIERWQSKNVITVADAMAALDLASKDLNSTYDSYKTQIAEAKKRIKND